MSLTLQFGVPGGAELLVLLFVGLFLVVVPLVLAYWVYTDAERRGEDNAALWALAVGALTAFTFVGGIVALFVYLLQRD